MRKRVFVLDRGDGDLMVVVIYVDDLLLAAKSRDAVVLVKELLKAEFKIKDLGPVSFILGMEVIRDRKERTLSVNQPAYARAVLQMYNFGRCNKKDTPPIISAANTLTYGITSCVRDWRRRKSRSGSWSPS